MAVVIKADGSAQIHFPLSRDDAWRCPTRRLQSLNSEATCSSSTPRFATGPWTDRLVTFVAITNITFLFGGTRRWIVSDYVYFQNWCTVVVSWKMTWPSRPVESSQDLLSTSSRKPGQNLTSDQVRRCTSCFNFCQTMCVNQVSLAIPGLLNNWAC